MDLLVEFANAHEGALDENRDYLEISAQVKADDVVDITNDGIMQGISAKPTRGKEAGLVKLVVIAIDFGIEHSDLCFRLRPMGKADSQQAKS